MVKLEGGAWLAPTIQFLTERSIPVCAHLGLTPQSIHQMGGYKVQGKTSAAADHLKEDALIVQAAGAGLFAIARSGGSEENLDTATPIDGDLE